MRVKILKTIDASPNGIEIIRYREGEVLDMPENLAQTFIKHNWGDIVMSDSPPSNKMQPLPENKQTSLSGSADTNKKRKPGRPRKFFPPEKK